MTDQSQNIVNKYAYDSFGNVVNQVEAMPQPFKFVGQHGVMTEPNGFYYMRARYYDPSVGRFISEDPIGFDGGDVNLYGYVGNNPVNLIDPFGLCAEQSKPPVKTPTQAENPLPKLPTFSESFPNFKFLAPTADIIVGGIEAGFAITLGVASAVTYFAGPEAWPITIVIAPISVTTGVDAYKRIRTGIRTLNANY